MNKSVKNTPLICGHIELGGIGVTKYNKTNLCSACYESINDTEFAAVSKLAAQQNEQYGLPKLEGSDRQVAFAEIIRAEILPQLDGLVLSKQIYTSSSDHAEYLSDCAAAWEEIAKKIKSVSTAEWFITARKTNLITKIAGGFHDYGEGEFVISTTDYEVLKKMRLHYLRNFKIKSENQEG